MAENDMVEKVARAIFETWRAMEGSGVTWDGAVAASKYPDTYPKMAKIIPLAMAEARAAIEATPLERYEELLRRIQDWIEAYPLDVFPEPDLKRARELLNAGGIELGSVAASNMRHVLSGIQAMIDSALSH